MDHNDILLRYVYLPLAALTGAISSLGARRWRQMGRGQIALVIVTVFSFGYFVAPALSHSLFGIDETDARKVAAVVWVFSWGWHVLLPAITARAARAIGTEHDA